MHRRKFISLALAGILVPEYLLKGRSMVSVPQMPDNEYFIEDFIDNKLFDRHLEEWEFQLSKDYFKYVDITINGFWDGNYNPKFA